MPGYRVTVWADPDPRKFEEAIDEFDIEAETPRHALTRAWMSFERRTIDADAHKISVAELP